MIKRVLMAAAMALLLAGAATAADYGDIPEVAPPELSVAEAVYGQDRLLDEDVAVHGRVSNVCTHRGCWAILESEGEMLRIKADDHAFAMPADYRGEAIAFGRLELVDITPEHARHLVEDDGADPAILEQDTELRLIASGVRFLDE